MVAPARNAVWLMLTFTGLLAATFPPASASEETPVAMGTGNDNTTWVIGGYPKAPPSIIMIIMYCYAGVFVLAIAAVAARGKAALSVLLCLTAYLALGVVAVLSWGFFFRVVRDIMHSNADVLVDDAVRLLEGRLRGEFGVGMELLRALQSDVRNGDYVLSNDYPHAYKRLISGLSFKAFAESISMFYFGARNNGDPYSVGGPALTGIRPLRDAVGSTIANKWLLCTQPEYGAAVPEFVVCPARDRSGSCEGYVCGTNADDDFRCQATCAERNATVSASAPGYCTWHPGSEERQAVYFEAQFDPINDAAFRPLPGSTVPHPPQETFYYNPMERPWWRETRGPVWSELYAFASTGFMGITLSMVAVSPEGTTVGTLAVDYSIASLQRFLESFRVTKHSLCLLVDLRGNIVSTSLAQDDIAADTSMPVDGLGVINYYDDLVNLTAPSNIREALADVLQHSPDGTFQTLHHRIKFYSGGYKYQAVRFSDDFMPEMLMLIRIPVHDFMQEIEDGSEVALIGAIGIACIISVVVFGLVRVLLLPLNNLAARMREASLSKLDGVGVGKPSRVVEVAGLQTSFTVMLDMLREYREFLPQSLIEVGGGQSSSGCDMNNTGGSEAEHSEVDHAHVPLSDREGPLMFSQLIDTASAVDMSSYLSDRSGLVCETERKSVGSSANIEGSVGGGHANELGHLRESPQPTIPHRPRLQRANTSGLFTMALADRRITLLLCRVRNFDAYMNDSSLLERHTDFLAGILALSRARHGIVDGFTGDSALVGFNTVNQRLSHKLNAVQTAVDITATNYAMSNEGFLAVSVGLASGKGKVGNMGCTGLKKFTIVGPVMDHVRYHAQLAVQWRLGVVAEDSIMREHRSAYQVRLIYAVAVKSVAYMISEIGKEIMTDQTEWMYQLMQAEARQEFAICNKAVELIFAGDLHRAVDALTPEREDAHVGRDVDRLIAWAEELIAAGLPAPLPIEMDAHIHTLEALAWVRREEMKAAVSPRTQATPHPHRRTNFRRVMSGNKLLPAAHPAPQAGRPLTAPAPPPKPPAEQAEEHRATQVVVPPLVPAPAGVGATGVNQSPSARPSLAKQRATSGVIDKRVLKELKADIKQQQRQAPQEPPVATDADHEDLLAPPLSAVMSSVSSGRRNSAPKTPIDINSLSGLIDSQSQSQGTPHSGGDRCENSANPLRKMARSTSQQGDTPSTPPAAADVCTPDDGGAG